MDDEWPKGTTYDVYEFSDDGEPFHVGQSYEHKVVRTLICRKCRGATFNVGQGNHYTAMRCVTCKWEICIHEG